MSTSEKPSTGKIINMGNRKSDDLAKVRENHSDEVDFSLVPFPADIASAGFHGVAGEVVAAIRPYTEANPNVLLGMFLVGVGNLLGRHVLRYQEGRHFPNLYLSVVGSTSAGRKGVAWERLKIFFRGIDGDWAKNRVRSGLSSGEGVIAQFQQEAASPEGDASRLLIYEPEFGRVFAQMNREGNILSMLLREAWDSGDFGTLTKVPLSAHDAHLSLIASITPEELRRLLRDGDIYNGFANRFLWMASRRSQLRPLGEEMPLSEINPFVSRIHDILRHWLDRVDSQALRLSSEGEAYWVGLYGDLVNVPDGVLGSLLSRGAPIIIRLAVIYAALDQASEIERVHLAAARAVWEYSVATVRWLWSEASGDTEGPSRIVDFLRRKEDRTATLTEISRKGFSGHVKERDLRRWLTGLEQMGIIGFENASTGGRPVKFVFLKAILGEKSEIAKKGGSMNPQSQSPQDLEDGDSLAPPVCAQSERCEITSPPEGGLDLIRTSCDLSSHPQSQATSLFPLFRLIRLNRTNLEELISIMQETDFWIPGRSEGRRERSLALSLMALGVEMGLDDSPVVALADAGDWDNVLGWVLSHDNGGETDE